MQGLVRMGYLNILKHGDCLELLKQIPDNSVHMVCADMPYGTTNCKWDTCIELEPLWIQLKRVTKNNSAIVLFGQTPFDKVLGASNLPMLRYEIIWEKTAATGSLNANKMPMKAHENILVFYKNLPTYNPQKTTGHKPVNKYVKKHNSDGNIYGNTHAVSGGGNTDRYPRSVLLFKSDKQTSSLHETQKPLALIEYLIKTYSNVGEIVLDFCMGSGTAKIACKNTNRSFIGFEKGKEQFDVAVARFG
tara:strand:- start:302 stop:1042 length:741 start_codon:yes stop_codon:yes gene_type:complete